MLFFFRNRTQSVDVFKSAYKVRKVKCALEMVSVNGFPACIQLLEQKGLGVRIRWGTPPGTECTSSWPSRSLDVLGLVGQADRHVPVVGGLHRCLFVIRLESPGQRGLAEFKVEDHGVERLTVGVVVGHCDFFPAGTAVCKDRDVCVQQRSLASAFTSTLRYLPFMSPPTSMAVIQTLSALSFSGTPLARP